MLVTPDSPLVHQGVRGDIHAETQAITFADGSTIALHHVSTHGVWAPALRAMADGPGRWLLLDMRDIAPRLADDLRLAHERDKPGLLLFHLRALFPTARLFELTAGMRVRALATPANDLRLAEALA